MEKGAKTTPGISPGTPPKLPISVPYLLRDLMEGLVAFGTFSLPWSFPWNVQPIQAAFRAGISCLAIRILAAPRKRKMTRKAPRRSLGNQKRFFETNDDFCWGSVKFDVIFLPSWKENTLKLHRCMSICLGHWSWEPGTAACPPPSTHVCLRKTPLSAEEQKEFAQLQSLDCSEDVLPLPPRNFTHPPARKELWRAEGKGTLFFPEKEAQNH